MRDWYFHGVATCATGIKFLIEPCPLSKQKHYLADDMSLSFRDLNGVSQQGLSDQGANQSQSHQLH